MTQDPTIDHATALLARAGLVRRRANDVWTDADGEVGAVLHLGGVLVGWIDVAWPSPSEPRPRLRDIVHLPVPVVAGELAAELHRCRRAREARLGLCRSCGRRFVPGHMHENDVCQGCAVRHLGVVH